MKPRPLPGATSPLTVTSLLVVLLVGCAPGARDRATGAQTVNEVATLSKARAADGRYISWREHVIDDASTGGDELRGGDGLQMADLDKDGYQDIVSVHESDTEYDSSPDGLIRIAFGSSDPHRWENVTLASGAEAAAPEDVAIADLNGDGFLDIVAACELAHLIYFQNPGRNIRTARWERLIPPAASNRGSFIRVFAANLAGDALPEVLTANKGAQNPSGELEPTAISWFEIKGAPLDGRSWIEHELARVPWPINSYPVDLDGDGDVDVLGGSVAERQIIWCENLGDGQFVARPLAVRGTSITSDARPEARRHDSGALVNGFHMEFADLSGDGRVDVVTFESADAAGSRAALGRSVVWLEQPASKDGHWQLHLIGGYAPDDVVGLAIADINGDGRPDVMSGGYSDGARAADEDVPLDVPAGRLVWFENPATDGGTWKRHDISRRRRGMFDQFAVRDMDDDGDVDFVTTRGNSSVFDGVFWLEQVRTAEPMVVFTRARAQDSPEIPLDASAK